MEADLAKDILAELRMVKWLMVTVVVLVGMFVVFFFKATARLGSVSGAIRESTEFQKFRRRSEELLMRGSYARVANSAKGRISVYPNDVMAHWFLAQALYHSGELVESKRVFLRVCDLDPMWEQRVMAWLSRLDRKLKELGPRIVG